MRKFKHSTYFHPKGCGPLALRQVSDAPDHAVMSAMILSGYDPVEGSTSAATLKAAARILGIKLGCPMVPASPLFVGALPEACPTGTFFVIVEGHVFVIKEGVVIDQVKTPAYELVEFVWPVE